MTEKPGRFSRTELLLGKKACAKLAGSSVAVFGLGAVGSYATEALARAGVGRLALVDFDEVRVTNINRQLYATQGTLGRFKADVARERTLDINPDCAVTAHRVFADAKAIPALCEGSDAVIDAIDSLVPKVALIEYCLGAGIPLVSSMGAGQRTDPTTVRAGDITEVTHCPLASRIRKRLRKRGVEPRLRCIYSVQAPLRRREAAPEEEFYTRGRARIPIGTVSFMTGAFGLAAAHEAFSIIMGDAAGRQAAFND